MLRLTSLVPVVIAVFAGAWAYAPVAEADSAQCSGDVVVALNYDLRARPGSDRVTVALAAPLEIGEYRVTTFSSDTRDGADRVQPYEQWTVTLNGVGGPLATVGPTSDLEDLVEYASSVDDLGSVALSAPVVSVTARHVLGEGGGQSVRAGCVGLTRVAVPPPAPAPDPAPDPEPDPLPEPDPDPDPAPTAPDDEPAPGVPPAEIAEPGAAPTGPSSGPQPAAGTVLISSDAVVDCAASTLAVSVANRGSIPTSVDIAVPRSAVARSITIRPGESTTTTVPLSPDSENQQLRVRVLDPSTGAELATSVVPVDCLAASNASAALTLDCVSAQVLVDLTNRGEEPAVLAVLSERGSLQRVEVAGRSSEKARIAIDGRDTIVVVVVDQAGNRLLERTIDVDCGGADIAASVSVDCDAGQVIVEATNDGDLAGSLNVTFADRVQELQVGAGSEATVSSPLVDLSSDRTVSVESGGRTVLATTAQNCVVPGATLHVACGALTLTLDNAGQGTGDFGIEVLADGAPTLQERQAVPPGRTELVLPAVDDVGWLVRVTEASYDGVVEMFSGEQDCRETTASVVVDCGARIAKVDLGVDGELGARFAVFVDDHLSTRSRLAAGESSTMEIAIDSSTAEVAVFDDLEPTALAAVHARCDAHGRGGLRLAGSLAGVMAAISAAAALAWKGS